MLSTLKNHPVLLVHTATGLDIEFEWCQLRLLVAFCQSFFSLQLMQY